MIPQNNNNLPSSGSKKISIRTMRSDKQKFSGVAGPSEEYRESSEPELMNFSQPSSPMELTEISEPKPIPDWARKKLEEEIYREPTGKKNLILTIIILVAVIICVLIGYFLAINFLFR